MTSARKLSFSVVGIALLSGVASAQVPNLLNAFDLGSRSLGSGGSQYATSADTTSTLSNPAGLAYVTSRSMALGVRTLPTTDTTITGSLSDKNYSSETDRGDYSLSHIGFVFPQSNGRSAFGFSYSLGGWMNDTETGTSLSGGIASYFDFARVRTSFVTLSYGTTNSSSSMSYGFGIVGAFQDIKNQQEIIFTDNNIPPQLADSEERGFGLGAVFGMMFTPSSQANTTFGFSVRTPIKINSDDAPLNLYKTIPGQASAGVAIRQDGVRGKNDYLIFSSQIDYVFGAEGSDRINREDFFAFGAGIEYNMPMGSAMLPIRLGYRAVPAGGRGFDPRNGLTYGFGYRPSNQPWSIEFNFSNPTGAGTESSVFLNYRLGK